MGSTNGTTPLEEYPDNDEAAYEVVVGGITDITAPISRRRTVSKREVREMFLKFMRSAPELTQLPRDEQIRQFNLFRREASCPQIETEILADLLVPAP